ncbi:MAG TPA: TauD/TfdA family dioxygenase [Thermoanaerobaculia bacterium]|nr:TauD/TfdA family dioxygenase [Thermoanaerobaculia bacterium]
MNEKPLPKSLGAIRRKAVDVSADSLVRFESLEGAGDLPRVVQAALPGVDLTTWVRENRERIDETLRRHGGILFRGFDVRTEQDLEALVAALSGELLEYTYRSTPRTNVSGRIYTSTEYPADQTIPMHNEMSYTASWPLKIWFFCMKAAPEGGETPIADSRRVYRKIGPAVRQRFADLGVLYVRNYGGGVDLSWQEVFQTSDRAEAEEMCRKAGIELEWLGGDRLRTRQVCQGVATHPRTGEPVWFNQAHLFHVSNLPAEAQAALLASFAPEDLPRNTYYGDGSPIEPETLAEIRRAYDEESVVFPWRDGDVVLLDNMLVAHGRKPFKGPRKVVVGMAEPFVAGSGA